MSKIHLKYDSASALTNNQVVKYNTTESGAIPSIIYDDGTNVGVGLADWTLNLGDAIELIYDGVDNVWRKIN